MSFGLDNLAAYAGRFVGRITNSFTNDARAGAHAARDFLKNRYGPSDPIHIPHMNTHIKMDRSQEQINNLLGDLNTFFTNESADHHSIGGDLLNHFTPPSDDEKDKHASPDLSGLAGKMEPFRQHLHGPVDVSARPFPRFPELKEPSLAPLAESVRGDSASGHSSEIFSQADLDKILAAFHKAE